VSGSEGWLLPLLAGALEPGGWLLTLATWLLAAALLTALLLLGSVIGKGLVLHQWGIPEALIAGSLGLLIAPDGALPLLPEAVIRCWDALPLPLLTLVFATLLLGKPLPRPSGLWRPLSAQVLMALTLAFGQFLVAGLAVLLLLRPLLGVSPVMACLIEVSFEGGHGSAAAMGPTYERLGVNGATALGLALSTVGLLTSTVVGGLVVVLARRLGWLAAVAPAGGDVAVASGAGLIKSGQTPPTGSGPVLRGAATSSEAANDAAVSDPAGQPLATTAALAIDPASPEASSAQARTPAGLASAAVPLSASASNAGP
jgi:ESS family glutamate:Na+ symporter